MFLRLPPEIRNMIYTNVLVRTDRHICPGPFGHTNSLAILEVCKQIHNEGIPIYYRHNKFYLANPHALFMFLRSMSIRRRRQIAHVILGDWDRRSTHATATFRKLGQCIRLTCLEVCFDLAQDGEWLRSFAGIKAFRALRGLKIVVFLDGEYELEIGGKFLDGVKKGLLEPRSACKRCERAGSPV